MREVAEDKSGVGDVVCERLLREGVQDSSGSVRMLDMAVGVSGRIWSEGC